MKINEVDFTTLKFFVVEPFDASQSDLRAELLGLGVCDNHIHSYDSMIFLDHVLNDPVDLIILNCMHGYFHEKILKTTLNILQDSVAEPIPVLFVMEKDVVFPKSHFSDSRLYSKLKAPFHSKLLYLKVNLLMCAANNQVASTQINEIVTLREDRWALQ